VLGIYKDDVVGFVVDSACSYFSPIAFPDVIHVGICRDWSFRARVR
jgi:acyl-CoA thioester hydrolase